MAARERDSGRAEAMPRGRDGWRAEVMTSGRDGGERKRCRGTGRQRGEGMPRGRDGGRAERAVPRRGTIVVSPTQLVPEVLAVWGSD